MGKLALFSVARRTCAGDSALGADSMDHQSHQADPWELASAAAQGNVEAEMSLWNAYRPRLKRMVIAEIDPRVMARIDPSDVVQDAILEAHRRLPDCVVDPPLPFYPWLRGIATDQLNKAHRFHLGTQARDVTREAPSPQGLPDDSVDHLASRLMHDHESPVKRLMQQELRRQVRETLDRLEPVDRRVLVLRLIEDMSTADTALVLGVSEPAVRMRLRRALERFADALPAAQKGASQS
jgi:RNA polymerase sigma-70 factor (ECF subfamily)